MEGEGRWVRREVLGLWGLRGEGKGLLVLMKGLRGRGRERLTEVCGRGRGCEGLQKLNRVLLLEYFAGKLINVE